MSDVVLGHSPETRAQYLLMRTLPDGRVFGVHPLLYHWTLHVDIDDFGYNERYCYPDLADALLACATWDGAGDPPGFWNRHPESGRRRDRAGNEWVAG